MTCDEYKKVISDSESGARWDFITIPITLQNKQTYEKHTLSK